MAAGDVSSVIVSVPFTTTSINSAVSSLRNGANDKWLMTAIDNQVIIVNIEEA